MQTTGELRIIDFPTMSFSYVLDRTSVGGGNCHHPGWSLVTISMLQATEDFMVHLFEDCNLCAIHAKRVTISEWLTLAASQQGCFQMSWVCMMHTG